MRAALVAALLLSGCTSLTVRAPICEPPPIPAEYMASCPPAIMPAGATFGDIYENAVANAAGPWRECVRRHDQLVSVVAYRDSVCAKIKKDNEQPRAWWRIWD